MDLPRQVEHLSKQLADEIFLGKSVKKYFEPVPVIGFEGGWFEGKIESVDRDIRDNNGVVHQGLLFLVS